MSRRPAVIRSNVIANSRAANRPLGGVQIFCDALDSGATAGSDGFALCEIPLTIMQDYTRCFFAATVLSIWSDAVNSPEFIARVGIVSNVDTFLAVRPEAFTTIEYEATTTITTAYDLPAGEYLWQLILSSGIFGIDVSCGPASLQIIVGQVLAEQECFNHGGSG